MQCDQTYTKEADRGHICGETLPHTLKSNIRMGMICGLLESSHQITLGPALKHLRSPLNFNHLLEVPTW